jgi:hypothetical protein
VKKTFEKFISEIALHCIGNEDDFYLKLCSHGEQLNDKRRVNRYFLVSSSFVQSNDDSVHRPKKN